MIAAASNVRRSVRSREAEKVRSACRNKKGKEIIRFSVCA